MVTLADITLARYRLREYLRPTLMEAAPILGPGVHLKLENTNITHAFKIRGAVNAALALHNPQRGIVAASSGNHAQGVAYAASLVGAKAKIYMPKATPARKINGVRAHGGEPVLYGDTVDGAEAAARKVAAEEDLHYISPYNDADVVAGQGTIGLEILDQMPDVARVLVCVSGGGLIAGIATAIKTLRPDVEIIGVGAVNAPAMYNFFHKTNLPHAEHTLAEALAGEIEEDSITLDLVRRYVDDVVLVDEAAIAEAMRWTAFEAGWIAEGGGVVCIAALLNKLVESAEFAGPTAVIVSGGNVDEETLKSVLAG